MGSKRLKDETKHHLQKICALSKGHAEVFAKLSSLSKERTDEFVKALAATGLKHFGISNNQIDPSVSCRGFPIFDDSC